MIFPFTYYYLGLVSSHLDYCNSQFRGLSWLNKHKQQSTSTRDSHSDHQYLAVPLFHSSLYKSNTLAIVLSLILLRLGMTCPTTYVVHHLLPPSGRSSKLTCLKMPIHHSCPVTPPSSLVWPGCVIELLIIDLAYALHLRVCQLEIKHYKRPH